MELTMWRHLRHPLPVRITNSPASKLMALVVVLIVPGGLMLPLCYAAYAAVVHSATRRALGRSDGGQPGQLGNL
jgi:hypothetical protein